MKKLFAALGAVILAATLAAPGVAEAIQYYSSIGNGATAPEGASAYFVDSEQGGATIENFRAGDTSAVDGYKKPAEGGAYLGTFYANANDVIAYGDNDLVTLGFIVSVDQQYAGREVTAYVFTVTSGDGGTTPVTATVSEWGTLTIPVTLGAGLNYGIGVAINVEPADGELTGEVLYPATTGANATVTAMKSETTTGSIKAMMETDKTASNYKVVDGQVLLGSFEAHGDAENFVLTYNVDKKYAGKIAMLYVEHEDGATEIKTATVAADGTVSFTMDRLSIYTLVIDTASKPAGNPGATTGATTGTKKPVAKKDTSSKSPVTSARSNGNVSLVAAGSAVALVAAAGCAAFAFRKVNGR